MKPNGDYWFCQDQPSPIPLNVLDQDFEERRRAIEKAPRRRCSGCVYSCYYLVQKSMEPRHWRDIGMLWWQANTSPGGPERAAAAKYGPLGALACYLWRSAGARPLGAALGALAVLVFAAGLMAAPPAGVVNPDDVLQRMEDAGARQRADLQQWSSERVYRAGNTRLGRSAKARVHVNFTQPGVKSWRILSREGSGIIVDRVIKPLLEAEQESAQPIVRRASDIHRSNYVFRYAGFDEELQAYIFEATPRRPSKFQFRGKVAVDAETYGVRRVWGEPAVRPSFWVRRTEFVHDYGRSGGFWLPVRNRTLVELRVLGLSTLEIDYGEYEIRRAVSAFSAEGAAHQAQSLIPGAADVGAPGCSPVAAHCLRTSPQKVESLAQFH